jgi:tRNA nucleotidyltransferase (CCA-adding enzyme)
MQRRLWTYLVNHPLISMRFKTLLDRIKPLQSEVDKARVHVALIRNRLSRYFDVRKSFLVGSHWKGTAIKTFSDIDVFVVMSRDEGRRWSRDGSSETFLNRIRNNLQERFPQTTVRRDGQAVVVAFGQRQYGVDVVPATFGRFGIFLSYLIPDGQRGLDRDLPGSRKKAFYSRRISSRVANSSGL